MNQPVHSSRFRTVGFILAGLVLATVGLMKFVQQRQLGREVARRTAEVEAGPRVRTLVVDKDSSGAALTLQGEALPMFSATLYAKIGGLLKEIRVDKGSRVRKGDVLAIVESPETDRETFALKSNYENLQRTADRLRDLGKQGVAADQDVDNAEAAARVAKENWLAQTVVAGYEEIVAPFSGVVTARFVDPGAFIQNATGSLASQPIVSLVDVSRLRVTFFLDQTAASLVRVGQELDVSLQERPDLVSHGRVSRVASALDVRTRTMLAEADLDNQDGRFVGGDYVRVAIRLPRHSKRTEIP